MENTAAHPVLPMQQFAGHMLHTLHVQSNDCRFCFVISSSKASRQPCSLRTCAAQSTSYRRHHAGHIMQSTSCRPHHAGHIMQGTSYRPYHAAQLTSYRPGADRGKLFTRIVPRSSQAAQKTDNRRAHLRSWPRFAAEQSRHLTASAEYAPRSRQHRHCCSCPDHQTAACT